MYTGVRSAIAKFCFRNVKGYNIRYFWCEGFMKYAIEMKSVTWYTYEDYDDWFKHFSEVTITTATIWEAVTLILLIKRIYEVVQMASRGMIYIQTFMNIGAGVQAMLRFNLRSFNGCNVCVTDGRGFKTHRWDGLKWDDYIQRFIKIAAGVQEILKFKLWNSNDRNVYITDWRDSWSAPWR